MASPTYLAKDGKLSGPYASDQIEVFKKDGSFYTFEWMWDGQSPDWTPVPRRVKGPPALPKVAGKKDSKLPAASAAASANVEMEVSDRVFQAICYDNRHITLAGEVTNANSRSAKFISSPSAKSSFPKGAQIWVDLLDEKTDRAAKVKSVIAEITRTNDSCWVYSLQWQDCPLLKDE